VIRLRQRRRDRNGDFWGVYGRADIDPARECRRDGGVFMPVAVVTLVRARVLRLRGAGWSVARDVVVIVTVRMLVVLRHRLRWLSMPLGHMRVREPMGHGEAGADKAGEQRNEEHGCAGPERTIHP